MKQTALMSISLSLLGGIFLLLPARNVSGKAPNINQEVRPPEGRASVEARLIGVLNKPVDLNRPKTTAESDCPEDLQAASLANQRSLRQIGLVHLQLEQRPFHEAVKELQESGVLNILVDPRTKEQSAKPISALLANVPA